MELETDDDEQPRRSHRHEPGETSGDSLNHRTHSLVMKVTGMAFIVLFFFFLLRIERRSLVSAGENLKQVGDGLSQSSAPTQSASKAQPVTTAQPTMTERPFEKSSSYVTQYLSKATTESPKDSAKAIVAPENESVPWCSPSGLAKGVWMYNASRKYDFGCCTWASVPSNCNYRMVSRCRNSDGTMLRRTIGGHGCACKDTEHRYEWKPEGCRMTKWDANEFCLLIANTRVVIMGDSLLQQTFGILLSLLEAKNASCSAQVVFAEGDTLDGKPHGVLNRGDALAQVIERESSIARNQKQRVLIIPGVAAHIVPANISETVPTMQRIVTEARDLLTRTNTSYLWLAPYPPHLDCQSESSNVPFPTNFTVDQIYTLMYPMGVRDDYRWRMFSFLKDVVHEIIPKERLLHIWNPLMYRRDGHNTIECLHWCYLTLDIVPFFILHHLRTMPWLLNPEISVG